MALTIGQQQAAARIARRQQNAAGVAAGSSSNSSSSSSGGGSSPNRPIIETPAIPAPAGPKVGDIIPGTNLRYEASDIANLSSGGGSSSSPAQDLNEVIGAGPNAGRTVGEVASDERDVTFNSTYQSPRAKLPNETTEQYAAFLRSQPFYFAGTGGGGSSQSLAASTPAPNRPLLSSGFGQNSLAKANTSGSGVEDGVDYRSQEEKDAEAFLNGQPTKVKTEQEIINERTEQAKGLIGSLDTYYQSRLKDQEEINKQRSAETNAQSVLRGLAGSTEAGGRAIATSEKNARANESILAEKQTKLSEIYTNIQKDAREEARNLLQDAKTNAKDTIARAEAKRAKAVENVKILAGAGFDLDAIRREDPATYQGLVKSVGDEKQLKAMFVINRPKNDIVGTPIRVGNHYVQMYKNPLTGAIIAENIDLPGGLPENYSKFEKIKDAAGNEVLVAIPDNWDGDPSKLKKVGGGSGTGGGVGTGTYVKGANPVVDAWAQRIWDGSAKITDIPAADRAMRNAVTVALEANGNDLNGKPTVTELGLSAKQTAQDLLKKLEDRKGTSAVGGSRFLGGGSWLTFPGTDKQDFINTFDSLKSQLALEGVKYLKGQGAVSDAERALLSQAVTKLSLSQSEEEFKKTLQGVIDRLNGTPSNSANLETQRAELRSMGYTDEQIAEIEKGQ